MSIGNLLGIARSALQVHQLAVGTAAQNIANAQTEGYSRRRLELQAGTPVRFAYGNVGTGVRVTDISRARDAALDASYRSENGNAAGSTLQRDLLRQVEGVLGEPSNTGLAAGLDAFWSAWADLANNPGGAGARSVVRQRGAAVADLLNGFAGRLDELELQTKHRLQTTAATATSLGRQIAELNAQVVSAETGGQTAGDLRDLRDRLLDQLSGLAPTRVLEREDGSVAVYLGAQTFVDGVASKALSTSMDATGAYSLKVEGRVDPLALEGGELGAALSVLNTTLRRPNGADPTLPQTDPPSLRVELNRLAQSVVEEVNAIHQRAATEADPALNAVPVDFFDPAGTTAGTIKLSSALAANAGKIAAGVVGQPTDNSIALDLSRLRTGVPQTASTLDGKTIAGYYQGVVGDLATYTAAVDGRATAAETLVGQASVRRESLVGVSTDEEMIRLIQSQQAFTAASRLVSVADEMLQAILQMV